MHVMDSESGKPSVTIIQTDTGKQNNKMPEQWEPWFEDGNVVLQAENAQFRVYRGILSASSSVFADMFSIPQSKASTELVEGCPVVYLLDSADDWQIVLETLYQRR